jgi:SAM-dependent methyltransferase
VSGRSPDPRPDPGAFPDHFSSAADRYAIFRPSYPRELFALLADLCPHQAVAWDCATGSGQAASGLTEHFGHVIATDASAQQIEQAKAHPRIEYRVATAEASGLPDQSVDLITVAQALHWFCLEEFYAEARRVLRPGGLLAAWCYAVFSIEGGEVDAAVARFYDGTVGPFWPKERRWVDEGYRSLSFPSPELVLPPMVIAVELDLDAVLGYLGTWSAVQRYREARGSDPLATLAEELRPLWGDSGRRRSVRWPLHLRATRF